MNGRTTSDGPETSLLGSRDSRRRAPFLLPDALLPTTKHRSSCNQTASPRLRRSAHFAALPSRSRFSKYPRELGLTLLAKAKAIGSITRLEGLLLGVLEQLFR